MNSPSGLRPGSAGAQIHDQVLALVDPEPLPRECLAEVLQSAFPRTLVVAVADVGEVPAMSTPVALGLLKVPGPYAPGTIAQGVTAFEQHLPGTPVIVTGCASDGFAREAIQAGARGVLPVTDPLRIAKAAVGLVLAGGTYYPFCFPPEIRFAAVADTQCTSPTSLASSVTPSLAPGPSSSAQPGAGNHAAHFTARELDVLAALQQGRSNKWIASHLRLSENTVKVHITHIMRKLKATNRTQAVIHFQTRRA